MSRVLPGEVPRLRAGAGQGAAGETAALVERAAVVIRAVERPAPLGHAAQARVLAALVPRPGQAHRRRRLLLPAFTLLGIVGTALGAAAALRWIRTPAGQPAASVAPQSPPPLSRAGLPAASAPAVLASPAAEVPPRVPVRATKPGFVRARRIIDPRQSANQLEIPPGMTRTRAGEIPSWRVKVCVSSAGTVSSASALDRVHPALDRQISRAMERWRYSPATNDGRPIHSCMVYRLTVEPAGAGLKAKAEP